MEPSSANNAFVELSSPSKNEASDAESPPATTVTTAGTTSRTSQPVETAVNIESRATTATIPPTSIRVREVGKYRGNFSTSICDLFSDPTRHSDCCALSCYGVLLSDKTRYLLTGELPPPWWKRLLINVVPFLLIAFSFKLVDALIPDDENDENGDAASDNNNSGNYASNSDTSSSSSSISGTKEILFRALRILFWIAVIVVCWRAWINRMAFRNELLKKLYFEKQRRERQERGEEDHDGVAQEQQQQQQQQQQRMDRTTHDYEQEQQFELHRLALQRDTICAHAACCGCYGAPDRIYYSNDFHELIEEERIKRQNADFCTSIWRMVSTLFCGCCGCWCQCCGMCAVGQEYREIEKMFDRSHRLIDYVTLQPFHEYFPDIEYLRLNNKESFLAHCGALSQLSIKLLKIVGVILLILFIFALTDIDSNFTFYNMLVLLATLFQSFLILHFVHWRWHRFDLSFDAVVKYFSCGFILSTGLTIVYEMIISIVVNIFVLILGLIVIGDDLQKFSEEDEPDPEEMKKLLSDYLGLIIFALFLQSFIIAALVEELCKYFGFWMLEHPDLMSREDLGDSGRLIGNELTAAEEDDGTLLSSDNNAREDLPIRSAGENDAGGALEKTLNTTGTGITIAMVATALGFACCENLMYVFVYTPASAVMEISTLLLRSLFPVHPLCAAIQSIGVCRRDLEGEKSFKLGRIIFPAVLLHGAFDFSLMLVAILDVAWHLDDESDEGENGSDEQQQDFYSELLKDNLLSLAIGMALVVIGIAYYIIKSRSQKARLAVLETTRQSTLADGAALL